MMLPAEADKYAKEIDKEMPKGMKCYLELELFPCIHLKIGKGISLTTVHNWMHHNGFQYQTYKRQCILMDMSIQMWWNTDKMCSY